MPRITGLIFSRSLHQDFAHKTRLKYLKKKKKKVAEEHRFLTLVPSHHQVESTSPSHKDLLNDKERSWQVNIQLPQLGEKLNSSLVGSF